MVVTEKPHTQATACGAPNFVGLSAAQQTLIRIQTARLFLAAGGLVGVDGLFGDVEAVDFERWGFAGQGGGAVGGGDFALFPGKQAEVIVAPKNRNDVGAGGGSRGAQVDHEGHGVAEIFDGDMGGFGGAGGFGAGGDVEIYLRQSGQSGEVAEFGLRGVDGIQAIFPVEDVGLGREPVEIVAD